MKLLVLVVVLLAYVPQAWTNEEDEAVPVVVPIAVMVSNDNTGKKSTNVGTMLIPQDVE